MREAEKRTEEARCLADRGDQEEAVLAYRAAVEADQWLVTLCPGSRPLMVATFGFIETPRPTSGG